MHMPPVNSVNLFVCFLVAGAGGSIG